LVPPEDNNSKPDVPVIVELHDSLDYVLKNSNDLYQEVSRKISQGLNHLMDVMGIPGKTSVSFGSPQGNAGLPEAILRLYVNGRVCYYPDELLQRVYCYIKGVPLGPAEPSALILDWLTNPAHSANEDRAIYTGLVDFLELICLEIIKKQPDVLLGQPQLEAYLNILRNLPEIPENDASDKQDGILPSLARFFQPIGTFFSRPRKSDGKKPLPDIRDWLLPILPQVLNLRISIADTQTINQVIGDAWEQGRSEEDAAEDLIAALRPGVVEIQLPLNYLQEITSYGTDLDRDSFTKLRDGLYYEDGLPFPDFRFVPVDHLKADSFAFKINHVPCTPRIGLRPGTYVVNESVAGLSFLNQNGQIVIDPVNLRECGIVISAMDLSKDHADLLRWDPLSYLFLSLIADLKENYTGLVDREVVVRFLNQLILSFQALALVIQQMFSLEDITRVLRLLLAESLSIRNLRAILEAIIDSDYLVIDDSEHKVFDRRLALPRQPEPDWRHNPHYLTSYVRNCLKKQISQKFSVGWNTMKVLMLDPEIERMVEEREDLAVGANAETPEITKKLILGALQREMQRVIGVTPSEHVNPAILTRGYLRPGIRQLISQQFPKLPVLSYQELPDRMLEELKGNGGKIIKISLSPDDKAKLQAALDAAKQ
jgi:hypothetical protein